MTTYDSIVIGLGGMGSAAAAHLARRGARVLGIDQFERCHDRGSSHGQSRIIRESYYEAPEYVPLLFRAYELWRELEQESGQALLTITGGLNMGTPTCEFVAGALASARQHGLAHEYLTATEINARFPAYRVPENIVAVYEPNAGILQPEACVVAHLDLAARHGAELTHGVPVRRWHKYGAAYRVETDRAVYTAESVVVTAGPWASSLLSDLGLPLEVWRVVNAHFQMDRAGDFDVGRCPVYLWQVPEGDYYGFPALPGQGVKFGRHDLADVTTADTIRRSIDDSEVEALRSVLNAYMPGAGGALIKSLTCMYTITPDRHFVIDRHPEHDRVAIGCGFSGHGYKFASVVGELLADLALDGRTRHSIDFLSARRFAATN
jgi:sarcosine oxidase